MGFWALNSRAHSWKASTLWIEVAISSTEAVFLCVWISLFYYSLIPMPWNLPICSLQPWPESMAWHIHHSQNILSCLCAVNPLTHLSLKQPWTCFCLYCFTFSRNLYIDFFLSLEFQSIHLKLLSCLLNLKVLPQTYLVGLKGRDILQFSTQGEWVEVSAYSNMWAPLGNRGCKVSPERVNPHRWVERC